MFGGVYEIAAKGGGFVGLMNGIGAMDAGVDGGGGGGATIATGFGVATGTFVAGSFMLYKILLNRGVQGVYPPEKIFSEKYSPVGGARTLPNRPVSPDGGS